jgi:hypothetical protein
MPFTAALGRTLHGTAMRLSRRARFLLLALLASVGMVPAWGQVPAVPAGSLQVVRQYPIPVTEYRWRTCWRRPLNPFAPAVLVWELVPCTRWEWRCEVVAVPPPPGRLQTLEAPYRSAPANTADLGGMQRLDDGPPRIGLRLADRAAVPARDLRSTAPATENAAAANRAGSREGPRGAMPPLASDKGWQPARASLRQRR